MTRRRRIVFALVTCAAAVVVPLTVLLAVDVHLHAKYETAAGFNVWGYRGPAIGRKKAGEYRVAMLGGSAAYGHGVSWDEAIPAQLERRLIEQAPAGRRSSVANLGYNNAGVYSFTFTLNDYEHCAPTWSVSTKAITICPAIPTDRTCRSSVMIRRYFA